MTSVTFKKTQVTRNTLLVAKEYKETTKKEPLNVCESFHLFT